jgi:hypothetical protein
MTDTPRLDLTFTDFTDDDWNVMRGYLPREADVALLLAASDAAYRLVGRIMRAERRAGLDEATALLLELAHMKVIARAAMLDTWRRMRLDECGPFEGESMSNGSSPNVLVRRGEDSGYARSIRMRPEWLERVIAIVDEQP